MNLTNTEALRIVLDVARDWAVDEEEAEGALEREEDDRALRSEPRINGADTYPDADLVQVFAAITVVDRLTQDAATSSLFYVESDERDSDGAPVVTGCVVAHDAEDARALIRQYRSTDGELRVYAIGIRISPAQARGLVDMQRG